MNEAPAQLGPLYSRYKAMYSKILDEQKKARERDRRNEKQRRIDQIKSPTIGVLPVTVVNLTVTTPLPFKAEKISPTT